MDDLEQALIARAKQGEMEGFEQLVTAYEARIYRLVLKLTDDPLAACCVARFPP